MSGTGWQAWYVAKHPDGSWNFGVTTKVVVMQWNAVEVTGGLGVEVHGFVVDPTRFGETGGLVPAGTVVIPGYDGPHNDQYFVTYLRDDEDDEECSRIASVMTS